MNSLAKYVGAGAFAVLGSAFASEANAECMWKLDNGKRGMTHIQAAGAFKACAIQFGMAALKERSSGTAEIRCSGQACDADRGSFSYNIRRPNIVTWSTNQGESGSVNISSQPRYNRLIAEMGGADLSRACERTTTRGLIPQYTTRSLVCR